MSKNYQARLGSICYNIRFRVLKEVLPYSKKVLEIGCGYGMVTEELTKKQNVVTALDSSKKAITSLKKKNLKVKLICQGLLEFSARQKYDSVICTEVLEHIKDDIAALKKIHRLLKNKGEFILTVPICKYKKSYQQSIGHYRHYQPSSLKKMLAKIGFRAKEEKIWGSFFRHFIIYTLEKKHVDKAEGQIHPLLKKFLSWLGRLDLMVCPLKTELQLVLIKKG